MQTDAQPITDALIAMGAGWDDLSDVVLTHAYPEHCGALLTVALRAPSAVIWGVSGDTFPTAARPAEDRTVIHGLRVVSAPGHTPGHLCLLDEGAGIGFAGDAIGSQLGGLTQGPQMFIADAQQAARSLQRLVELRPDRMLFGHGGEVAKPADTLANFPTP